MIRKYLLLLITTMTLASIVYYRVRINELNLTTGLLFLATICTLAFLLSETAISRIPRARHRTNELRLLVATLGVLLFVLELFLRFGVDHYATYLEKNGSRNYHSPYQSMGPTWFHTNALNGNVQHYRPEFIHTRTTNSLGLSEEEVPASKAPNEYRIIALGDSYTEGLGTTYDSTWVKVVERQLAATLPHKTIRTINAGISGSDVFFEYMLLRERLVALDPDLVVLATNTSDVADFVTRGGMERFQPNGSVVTPAGPPWEWAFAISYIVRYFIQDVFHYNWFLISQRQMPTVIERAIGAIRTAIDSVAALGTREGFDLLVVVHPTVWEAIHDEWSLGFDDLVTGLRWGGKVNLLDLLEYYRINQITTRENAAELFWPLDGHYNTRGYRAMGNAVAETILRTQLIAEVN